MSNPRRIALAGTMPGGGLNGLEPYHDDLLVRRKTLRLVVALVDVAGTGSNTDREEEWPIVRLRHVEMITDEDSRKFVAEAMTRAMTARTGQEALPFEDGTEAPPPGKGAPADEESE